MVAVTRVANLLLAKAMARLKRNDTSLCQNGAFQQHIGKLPGGRSLNFAESIGSTTSEPPKKRCFRPYEGDFVVHLIIVVTIHPLVIQSSSGTSPFLVGLDNFARNGPWLP